ncbi:hypothetical protein BSKO_01104 [Bryopsis sp. KO-2023]|nr:hypothetical protein BSKO_01104 [Bryopsis sp. KO-2023]
MSGQSHPGTIFVRGLPTVIQECDLVEAFSGFGAVEEAVVARFSKDGPSLGYGFVTFSSNEAAESARSIVDGKEIDCKHLVAKLTVQQCKDCCPRECGSRIEKRKLYVSHFGGALDSEGLEKLFQKFGTVTSAQVVYSNFGGSRGFGFVTFDNVEEAAHALSKMQNFKLPDQNSILVEYAHCEKFSKRDSRVEPPIWTPSSENAMDKENLAPKSEFSQPDA